MKRRAQKADCIVVPKEADEQRTLIEWATLQSGKYPELKLLFAIPNGEFRHMSTGKALKAMGVKAGVPDICLPVARGIYHGLYVELKRQKNSRTSDEQEGWLDALSRQGYLAIVCKGWHEASEVIMQYLRRE